MKAFYFDGDNGENIREEEIPAELRRRGQEARARRSSTPSPTSTTSSPRSSSPSRSRHRRRAPAAIRRATIALKMTPVIMRLRLQEQGRAAPARRRCTTTCPNPTEVTNEALDQDKNEEKVVLESDPKKPFVGLAFKLEDGRYGQLTYMRIYQGTVTKGDFIFNSSPNEKKVKVPRLVRMHSDEMNDIERGDAPATSSRSSASSAPRATRSPTARSTTR